MSSITYKMIISPTGVCNLHKEEDYNWIADIKIDKKKNTFSIGRYNYSKGDESLSMLELTAKISFANAQYHRINNFISSYTISYTFWDCFIDVNIDDKVKADMEYFKFNIISKIKKRKYDNIEQAFENFKQAEMDKNSIKDVRILIYMFGQSVKQMRDCVGKGAWARLSKLNAYTLKLIFDREGDINQHEGCLKLILDIIDKHNESKIAVNSINQSISFPSKIKEAFLRNLINGKIDALDEKEVSDSLIKIRDCHSIMNRQGQEFNPHWSIKRITEEHDYWSSRQTYETMGVGPNDIFEIPKYFKSNAEKNKKNNIEYKFLSSSKDYLEEGRIMGHCIANYAKKAKKGDYVTLNIKQGDKVATVGYNKAYKGYNLEQMYSKYNRKNYTPEMREFAESLCKEPIISKVKIKTSSKKAKESKLDFTTFLGCCGALFLITLIIYFSDKGM